MMMVAIEIKIIKKIVGKKKEQKMPVNNNYLVRIREGRKGELQMALGSGAMIMLSTHRRRSRIEMKN